MKVIMWIVLFAIIGGGVLWAKGKVIKTDTGFKVKTVHTYYHSNVSWGEGYLSHVANTPITGIAVLAVGTGWTYSTVTDVKGEFKIKVKPLSPFKLHISDGNEWIIYETDIKGVPEGTTVSELPV